MSGRREIALFRCGAWAFGGLYCLIGLWSLIVGHSPFLLGFGLLTLLLAEFGLWQHRRWLRRQAETSDDGHRPLA